MPIKSYNTWDQKLNSLYRVCILYSVNNHQTFTRPGHNHGGHSRCDYVRLLVFQEKPYKTNLHLFYAYAGVVWRSVNKNSCSRDSILLREGHIWWFLHTFSSIQSFISNSPIVLHHAIWRTVCLIITEWLQWRESWSQRLAFWVVQLLTELTNRCVFKCQLVTENKKMYLSLDRNN